MAKAGRGRGNGPTAIERSQRRLRWVHLILPFDTTRPKTSPFRGKMELNVNKSEVEIRPVSIDDSARVRLGEKPQTSISSQAPLTTQPPFPPLIVIGDILRSISGPGQANSPAAQDNATAGRQAPAEGP